MAMQDSMTQFVGQCKAPQCLREITSKPDQSLLRVKEAKGAGWLIGGMEGYHIQTQPRSQGIERHAFTLPRRATLAVRRKELVGRLPHDLRRLGFLCLHVHDAIHSSRLSQSFFRILSCSQTAGNHDVCVGESGIIMS